MSLSQVESQQSTPSSTQPPQAGPHRDRVPVGYLLGTSHCGSTLLAFLLSAHSKLISLGESKPNIRIQNERPGDFPCSCGESIDSCEFWAEIFRRVNEKGQPLRADQWTNDYRLRSRIGTRLLSHDAGSLMVQNVRLQCARWLPIYRRKIERAHRANVALFQSLLELTDARVVVDTSKRLLRLQLLRDVKQLETRVIWLVRDVRAYALSMKRKGFDARRAADQWSRVQRLNENYLSELPSDEHLRIRYEDLCSEPDRELGRIHAFLDVAQEPAPDSIRACDHHILGNRMRLSETLRISPDNKWKDQLSSADQAEALAVAGDINRQLGYAD